MHGLTIFIFQACAEHRLDSVEIATRSGFAVSVILASQGYPGSYEKGHRINIGNDLSPSMSANTEVNTSSAEH